MITEYCVVIPIWKKDLDCVEEISLNRLRKILVDDKMNVGIWHEYEDYSPVYLVCPTGLDTSKYEEIYNVGIEGIDLKKIEFDPKYFESTATYSQLCINYDFYRAFDKYKYMLIY